MIKLYNGYGNKTHCVVYGHVFSFSPLPRKSYRSNFLSNTLALLRLFMVKPMQNAVIQFTWEDKLYTTTSQADGFFKFEWQPSQSLLPGWHDAKAELLQPGNGSVIATGHATICIPYDNQYAFISDIDDTFLISHSSNLRKRLFVLLTENARSREAFAGVVNHYQLLSVAGASHNTNNPFFYVSSSEWNLYDYINEFSDSNKLPNGIYLLNQLKTFSQVFNTGQNNHKTKFMRIARIMEAYPGQQFVLLGDDSQEDPAIYASIVSHFKSQVVSVYIRKVHNNPQPVVQQKLHEMQTNGVFCCYFRHSAEAVIHSKKTGLIKE